MSTQQIICSQILLGSVICSQILLGSVCVYTVDITMHTPKRCAHGSYTQIIFLLHFSGTRFDINKTPLPNEDCHIC